MRPSPLLTSLVVGIAVLPQLLGCSSSRRGIQIETKGWENDSAIRIDVLAAPNDTEVDSAKGWFASKERQDDINAGKVWHQLITGNQKITFNSDADQWKKWGDPGALRIFVVAEPPGGSSLDDNQRLLRFLLDDEWPENPIRVEFTKERGLRLLTASKRRPNAQSRP